MFVETVGNSKMFTVCFIGCVKTKRSHKCKSKELYDSPLFHYSYKYALKNFDKVAILSAKHGLLDPEDVIEPYEVTLNNMSKQDRIEWSNKTTNQISQRYPKDHYKYYVISGKRYYEFLNIECEPLFVMSMGYKLQTLKKEVEK